MAVSSLKRYSGPDFEGHHGQKGIKKVALIPKDKGHH